jgi:hypothetical protein
MSRARFMQKSQVYKRVKMVPRGGIEPPTRGFSIFLGSHSNSSKLVQSDAKSI